MADDASPGLKLQTTIDGYEAWAFSRMMERTGWKHHDLCRSIVREWLHLKRDELCDEYGVSREEWEREKGGNVRPIGKGRKRSSGEG
jgi:hypothetical protein